MIEKSQTLLLFIPQKLKHFKHSADAEMGVMGLTPMKFIPLADNSNIMKTVKLKL